MHESNTLKQDQPRRRLSLVRVTFVIALISGLTYSTTLGFERWHETRGQSDHRPWFAAYVDVTSVPTYSFEKRGAGMKSDAMLAFIVSSHAKPCTPTWGGYYTMDEAAVALDLDRRIARLQQQEGRIAVSFGGVLNSELAVSCTDVDALYAAYDSVIERYHVNTIDLDLEQQGLTDRVALTRRAEVIAKLQEDHRKKGESIAIWLTLPVTPQGFSEDGTTAIAQFLSSGVDLSGVNVMTMDYGESRDKGDSMFVASKKALNEAHRQLGILYQQAGVALNSDSLWRKIGVTPMVGQNDVVDEVFTLEDAQLLNNFAREVGVGRMSMWSANRDIPCGENYVDVKVVSDLCSGVTSRAFAFTQTLGVGFDGDLIQNANILTVADPTANTHVVDDPEKSPYQIWRETGVYLKGTKVVWHGNVYEAKWWTTKELPDNPVLQAWETPWQLVGPVLPGDRPIKQPTLPAGTYPEWSGVVIYDAGARVLFHGLPFQAKWWNQGQSPAAAASNPDSSPWVPFTQEQVNKILESRRR